MSEFKYDKKYILDQTQNGLDIILHYYPEADKKGGRWQHFKLRPEESTASTIIIPESLNSIVTVKDFGSGDTYTCFDIVMMREGLEFGEACKFICTDILHNENNVKFSKTKIEFAEATEDQNDGEYYFDFKENLTQFELTTLGSLVTQYDCNIFALKSVNSFTQIKKYPADLKQHKSEKTHQYAGKTMQIITYSSESYPILVFDRDTWGKIYQPLNKEKKYRFRYYGKKPDNYVFGLESLEYYYENEWKRLHVTEEEKNPKFKNVVIASGDRDALNISSLGYPVLWLNSESATLQYDDYKRILDLAENVCYCGDLDKTGRKEAIKFALEYIDIKIIWLPEWITKHTYRGKPQKDVTDYVKLSVKQFGKEATERYFKKMVNTALPARFWETIKDKDGKFKGYELNNEAAYKFINYNGYYRYTDEFTKEDYEFIYVKDGQVEKKLAHDLKNFPIDYIRQKRYPISLLNYVHRSAQLTDKKLATIDEFQPDFTNTGAEFQRYFFNNCIATVTKDGITTESYSDTNDIYVWKDGILDFDFRKSNNKNFKIFKNAKGEWDIDIYTDKNHFLNYLINTSRIHWQKCSDIPFLEEIEKLKKEAHEKNLPQENIDKLIASELKEREAYRNANKFNIAESGLSESEIAEQKLCLINKIFVWGYLLHEYKLRHKSWVALGMDNRVSNVGESNGRSGKSILFDQAMNAFVCDAKYKYINAGDPEIAKSQFLFDGVTKKTSYALLDDIDSRFPFRKIFSDITGKMVVNPKGLKSFTLSHKDSPKMAGTINFGLYNDDASTLGRFLLCTFSDWYHYKKDNEYFESHDPHVEFGKNLITDFDDDEKNDFYNLGFEALHFFLNTDEKINPPLENITKRNAMQKIGNDFKEWADKFFFADNCFNLDNEVEKAFAHNDFDKEKSKATIFKKKVQSWCEFYGFEFNPKDRCNNGNRIIRNLDGAKEYFYIETHGRIPQEYLNQK